MPRRRRPLDPADRRQQLLDAATWTFARKGYRNAAVSDIIARAAVARGTFYLYFTSKEQVFRAIVEDFYERVKGALTDLGSSPDLPADGGPEALLSRSFRQWLEFFAANRDAATVVLKEGSSIDPRFEQGFAALRHLALSHFSARFRHLQTLGLARSTISADLVAHLQLGMFDELLNAFVLKDPNADLDALATSLANFEWSGIRPDRPAAP